MESWRENLAKFRHHPARALARGDQAALIPSNVTVASRLAEFHNGDLWKPVKVIGGVPTCRAGNCSAKTSAAVHDLSRAARLQSFDGGGGFPLVETRQLERKHSLLSNLSTSTLGNIVLPPRRVFHSSSPGLQIPT